MKVIEEIESQRKELNTHIKKLFKSGDLEISDEELDKTLFLLEMNREFTTLTEDYEFAQRHTENGMNLYQLVNADGRAKVEHGQEHHKDITANSVVLADKQEAIYQIYKCITSIVKNSIHNLKDPIDRTMFELLFIEGVRAIEAQLYMEQGYRGLTPLAGTTFYDHRRRAIKKMGASLKMAGVLALVGDEIKSKQDPDHKKLRKQFRFIFTEWEND